MRHAATALLIALASACSAEAPERAPAPGARPDLIAASRGAATALAPAAAPSPRRKTRRARPDGALCGDPRLAGARIEAINGPGGCGVPQPVRLSAAAGVRLEPPVQIGCEAARAIADWVQKSAAPAAEAEAGARLIALRTAAGYSCRTRNSRPGARLSEHAKGHAVDIAAFRFENDREITVADGWRGDERRFLRRVWRGACGPFGTVLGPDSDRFHQNHFHLDVARYRSGPYCR